MSTGEEKKLSPSFTPTPSHGVPRVSSEHPGQIGAYKVDALVGQGATALVLRATASDGRTVAIKLLASLVTRTDGEERFDRERRLLESLGPGFVPLLDVGECDEGPYLVMPFVEGGTLRDRLNESKLPVDDAVSVVRKIARAMAAAHAQGIVHRDLKPENVLFTKEGEPLVADLGLAKHYQWSGGATESLTLTQEGVMRGTPSYMPAEQMKDARAVGPSADVFSLGAILYECATGERPFPGMNMVEVVARVQAGTFARAAEVEPSVPAWLDSVISRAMAHDPAARFPDAGALAAALEPVAESSPHPNPPPAPVEGVRPPAPVEGVRPPASLERVRPRPLSARLAPVILVAAIAAIAFLPGHKAPPSLPAPEPPAPVPVPQPPPAPIASASVVPPLPPPVPVVTPPPPVRIDAIVLGNGSRLEVTPVRVGERTIYLTTKDVTAGDYLAFVREAPGKDAKRFVPVDASVVGHATTDLSVPDDVAALPVDGISLEAAAAFAAWAGARVPTRAELEALAPPDDALWCTEGFVAVKDGRARLLAERATHLNVHLRLAGR